MTMQSICPSEFTLERWRFGELAASSEESSLLAHVDACPACRQRLAEMAAAPAPVASSDAVWERARAVAATERPSRRWRPLRWSLAGIAAVALIAASTAALRRSSDEVLLKGSAWRLGVIAKSRDGAIVRVDPGAPLSAGDQLRFEVTTSWPKASIAIVMLDSTGKVSRLAPNHGQTLPVAGGKRVLLGDAVELDASLGPERIVLVGCPEARPLADIDQAASRALAAAEGDPRKVDGLGTGCHEESFWITKVSR